MHRILLVGGTGFLGSLLAAHLARRGDRVTVAGRFDPGDRYPDWTGMMEEVLVGDIRDQAFLSEIAGREFDTVVNLVGMDHTRTETAPAEVCDVNTMPTWNLLDHFTRHGLARFVYFSTQHVLGRLPPEHIDELRAPRPVNKHGLTHLLSEQVVDYYDRTTDTRAVSVRVSNGFGAPIFAQSRCWQYAINALCRMACEEGRIALLSDGSPLRDFIHVSDICRSVETLLRADCGRHGVYHLASGTTVTVLEAAHAVQRVYARRFGREVPVLLPDGSESPGPDRFRDQPRFEMSIARIAVLGVEPVVSLENGIGDIFDFLAAA